MVRCPAVFANHVSVDGDPRFRAGRHTARGVAIRAGRGPNQQQKDEPSFAFHIVTYYRKRYYPAAK